MCLSHYKQSNEYSHLFALPFIAVVKCRQNVVFQNII